MIQHAQNQVGSYEVVRLGWLIAAWWLWALSAFVMLGLWTVIGAGEGEKNGLLIFLCWGLYCLCASVSYRGVLHLPVGELRWDGSAGWVFESAYSSAIHSLKAPMVVLDAQKVLVLNLGCESGLAICIVVQKNANAAQWGALRRAVYFNK